jgi:phosphatidate cytidylyltransferase
MLKQRVTSALVITPLVLAMSWLGGWPFFVLIAVFSHMGLRELYTLTGQKDKLLLRYGYGGNIVLLLFLFQYGLSAFVYSFTVYFILLNCLFVITYPRDFRPFMAVVFGKVYITTLLGFFLLLSAERGFSAVFAVLIAVWASDSGAYFIGRPFGRRPLAPLVSPKKSLEGALGGLVTAMVMLYLLAPVLGMSQPFAILFGFCLSLAGQFGDLAESALKRWANTKDSGRFLPGHGGVLDRLDSILFAVPVAFLLLNFAFF